MPNARVLATDLEFPEGPVVMPDGSVVLVEIRGRRLTRVWPDGRKEVVAQIPGGPNGAHQVRGTVQQGLEIEGGVEGVRQPDEKLRLQRIHLDRAGQGQSFRTGPVIAFKRLRSKSLRRFFTGLGIVLVARRSHTNIES